MIKSERLHNGLGPEAVVIELAELPEVRYDEHHIEATHEYPLNAKRSYHTAIANELDRAVRRELIIKLDLARLLFGQRWAGTPAGERPRWTAAERLS